MPERHTKQNRFAGSPRARRRSIPGGVAHVRPEDTIGHLGGCWCGLPNGHDWPNKDEGAPHPREERDMSTATTESAPRLEARDLRKFPADVVTMMMELVNKYGIRYRFHKDGNHVFLYPPMKIEGDSNSVRPFKVGSHRDAQQALRHLERWVEEYVSPWLATQQAVLLAERFNDPDKRPSTRAKVNTTTKKAPAKKAASTAPAAAFSAPTKAAQSPAPEPTTPEPTPAPTPPPTPTPAPADPTGSEPVPFSDEAPEGYEPWLASTHNSPRTKYVSNWWKKIGENEWRCKSCDYVWRGPQLRGAHQRIHTMTADDRVLSASTAQAKAMSSLRAKKGANTKKIKKALALIVEATGVQVSVEDPKLQAKVTKLEAALAKVTRERDDLEARYDLIREAMRA